MYVGFERAVGLSAAAPIPALSLRLFFSGGVSMRLRTVLFVSEMQLSIRHSICTTEFALARRMGSAKLCTRFEILKMCLTRRATNISAHAAAPRAIADHRLT